MLLSSPLLCHRPTSITIAAINLVQTSSALLMRCCIYTLTNLFAILLNKSENRLYLSFSDWFGIKLTFVWCQINRKMGNTIWFRVDLIRFLSVCEGEKLRQRKYLLIPSRIQLFGAKLMNRPHNAYISPVYILYIH